MADIIYRMNNNLDVFTWNGFTYWLDKKGRVWKQKHNENKIEISMDEYEQYKNKYNDVMK